MWISQRNVVEVMGRAYSIINQVKRLGGVKVFLEGLETISPYYTWYILRICSQVPRPHQDPSQTRHYFYYKWRSHVRQKGVPIKPLMVTSSENLYQVNSC